MSELTRRFLEVQIDTIKITGVRSPGLRVTCKAERTLKPEPNECELTVYNLSPDHRASLTKIAQPVVSVFAGYEGGETTSVFYGQAVHVEHERNGPDIITHVSTSDGGKQFQTARVHKAFGARTKAGDVLRTLAKEFKIKVGNLDATVRKLNAGKAADMYAEGVNVHGQAATEITALCRSAGLEWSIQDGAFQFVDVGRETAKLAIVLRDNTLLGSPSISNKNVLSARTFLTKDFLPGRQVQVKSELVSGAFRLEKCRYVLDSYGDDWAVEFEAKGPPLKPGAK